MIRLHKTILLLCCILPTIPARAVWAGEVKSGYEYLKPETRAMQNDDFENPGQLSVEQGQHIFNNKQKGAENACADCHGKDGSKLNAGDIARYPVYDKDASEIVTLQKRINRCRFDNAAGEMLATDHPDLIALETFVRSRAKGEVVNVQTDGPMTALLEKGEKLYRSRYGLIDMACYHCHDLYTGQMIRGQKISQGQGNGFPAYRLDTGEMTTLHQRIQQCLVTMRAIPFEADSEELNLLGLYIMSRSNGLKIETPAVRY